MKENSHIGKRDLNRIVSISQCAFRTNLKIARSRWGALSIAARGQLKQLTELHGVSIAAGDLQLLSGAWYITHAGLLRIACRRQCSGIRSTLVDNCCDPTLNRWIFKATVYKSIGSQGFVGYGDADPSNVSPLVRGAEMRVAETRAVNRASEESLRNRPLFCRGTRLVAETTRAKPDKSATAFQRQWQWPPYGQPRLRDQLCLLIRKYNLDPNLVKAYAAHFCGTETIKDASRDLVESFISHLAASAKEDLDGLICKLNSYARPWRPSHEATYPGPQFRT